MRDKLWPREIEAITKVCIEGRPQNRKSRVYGLSADGEISLCLGVYAREKQPVIITQGNTILDTLIEEVEKFGGTVFRCIETNKEFHIIDVRYLIIGGMSGIFIMLED